MLFVAFRAGVNTVGFPGRPDLSGILAVPCSPLFAAVPLGSSSKGRFAHDLHARFVELLGVRLAMFLRSERYEIARIIVERVLISMVYLHT